MAFIREFIVYEKNGVKVYINQCHNPGRKTNYYTIRRDDNTGLGHFLGCIKFNPRWRQYVSHFSPNTFWSAGCKKKICEFENKANRRWRKKIRTRCKE